MPMCWAVIIALLDLFFNFTPAYIILASPVIYGLAFFIKCKIFVYDGSPFRLITDSRFAEYPHRFLSSQ